MKKFKFLIFLIPGFVFLNLSAQKQELDQPVPPDPGIKISKLENGLTYYIKVNKKPEERAELRLVINAGSICETDGQQGLAHFCEHMCFNGTKNFPGNIVVDILEEMGVKSGSDFQAVTSFDETIYSLKIPTDKLEWILRGFQVMEDWAHQLTFDDVEIDKERGVIVEEWRMGLGANDRMMQKYLPVLLKGSRYADRLPIGKVETIKTFPHDTLRNFYKSWYRPDLMAVVVVGDINSELAEELVKGYFGNIPKPPDPKKRVEYSVPDNTEPLISVVTDREASGFSAEIMFKQPKANAITYNDYRNHQMRLLYTIMLNSRFQEIVRKPEAPFLHAESGYGSFIGRSMDVYSLYTEAKENHIEESIELILTENERVRKYGFTSSEFERAKKIILSIYENVANESDKTESSEFADEFVRNFLTGESIPGYQKEYEMVKEMMPGIALEEINNLARKWITDKNILALITAQEKEGIMVPSEERVAEIIQSFRSKEVEAYTDISPDAPLLPEQPVPSGVVKRDENSKFGFTELLFGNGVRVVLKPTDFKNDEILMSAFSPGGISLYPDQDVMTATFASTIVTQSGLGNYNYTDLVKKLSGNTASLTPYINELNEGMTGSCSPKDLETMLQLNYLYFTGIRRDEDAFNSFISRIRNQIRPMRSVPMVIFTDTLSKIVSKNNPRIITVPTESQIDKINLDRLIEIFSDRFADASDFTYIMVGNFKLDDIIVLLEKYIGGLPSIMRQENWRDVSPEFPEGVVIVDVPKNSEPQSRVTMKWEGDMRWEPKERQGFSILISILDSRCRALMREVQGSVYDISITGTTSKFPEPEYTISSTWSCDPEKIEILAQTVLDEMNMIKKKGPAKIDLKKVKETMIREREAQIKENGFWLLNLQNHYFSGDRILSLEEYKSLVNSFTVRKIKTIASLYLNTDSYVRVALTPGENVIAE